MAKYEVYAGKFPCHTCKTEVTSVRLYKETKELTWLCKDGHMSSVFLVTKKKTKKEYQADEREG